MAVLVHGPGVHARIRRVVGQPPVGGPPRLGRAVGHQELQVGQVPGEPLILQVLGGKRAQQHGDLPVLHQLVGQPRIPPRDLGGDDRERPRLGRRVEPHPAILGRDAQAAQPGAVSLLQDLRGQPLGRVEQPLPFPVRLDKGPDHLVHVAPASLPHQALLVRPIPVRHLADSVLRTLLSHGRLGPGNTVPQQERFCHSRKSRPARQITRAPAGGQELACPWATSIPVDGRSDLRVLQGLRQRAFHPCAEWASYTVENLRCGPETP